MIPVGTTITRNNGVLYEMMKIVENNGAVINSQSLVQLGMLESTVSMSLAKRLRILPRGVVSKKLMGALSKRFSNCVCRTRQAITQPIVHSMAWYT